MILIILCPILCNQLDLTLKRRAQFLYHYIHIITRPIYGDAVVLRLIKQRMVHSQNGCDFFLYKSVLCQRFTIRIGITPITHYNSIDLTYFDTLGSTLSKKLIIFYMKCVIIFSKLYGGL